MVLDVSRDGNALEFGDHVVSRVSTFVKAQLARPYLQSKLVC